MRYFRLALLLLGFLALFAAAAPAARPDPKKAVAQKPKLAPKPKPAKPIKTPIVVKPTPKLAPKKPTKPVKPVKPAKPVKPVTPAKPIKPTPSKPAAKTTPTPTPALCTRDGENCGKTKDYLVVEAAAKKKKATLKVGDSYLLTEMSPAAISHHKLIVGTVVSKNGQLDFEATMTQLILDKNDRGQCGGLFGGKCINGPIENYQCAARLDKGAKFKFSGQAKPEFGDPQNFIRAGEALLIRNTKYNIISNNCQIYAKDLANTARMQ